MNEEKKDHFELNLDDDIMKLYIAYKKLYLHIIDERLLNKYDEEKQLALKHIRSILLQELGSALLDRLESLEIFDGIEYS